jgi:hypothetical protein
MTRRRLFVSLVVVVTIIAIAVFVRTPSSTVGEGGRGDRAGEERAGGDRGGAQELQEQQESTQERLEALREARAPVASDSARGSSRHPRRAGPASNS